MFIAEDRHRANFLEIGGGRIERGQMVRSKVARLGRLTYFTQGQVDMQDSEASPITLG
jgi:hypothetical protein